MGIRPGPHKDGIKIQLARTPVQPAAGRRLLPHGGRATLMMVQIFVPIPI